MLFWRCAKVYNQPDFYDAIKDMDEVSHEAVDAFKKADPNVFCRAYVKRDSMCDVIVSNMVETFNNYIMNARLKHIINMLKEISSLMMKRHLTKKEQAAKRDGILCPKVQEMLDKEKEEAPKCSVMPASTTRFQVSSHFDTLEVDIEKRECTYGKWKLKGIPCCQAVATLFYLHKEVES